MKPSLSIFVPLRDDPKISRLIRELEKQTYQDFELIVIDDSKRPVKCPKPGWTFITIT